ncbi:MAG TPA: hypothetical protein P5293_04940 [Bacteroidales bacterium]|nr:hypothetical protein [Bacteroidales bacterium]
MIEIKQLREHNEREIKELLGSDGESRIIAPVGGCIKYSYEFHGDHACEWAIIYKDGKEIARRNIAYVGGIIWD